MNKEPVALSPLLERFAGAEKAQIENALALLAPLKTMQPPRPTGEEVAGILLQFPLDVDTITAALLSDPRLRDHPDLARLDQRFNPVVVRLVSDVNWLNTLNVYSLDMANEPTQAETLRRMLLSMTRDVRAVLIKLAFRLQRLKMLHRESYEMRHFIAQETLDIYAPLANRLGIGQLKWELEDLAFRYLEPQAYRHIAQALADKRAMREQCIQRFIGELNTLLAAEGIEAQIHGRPKHIYSIWKKMQRKQLPIEELYDLLAVRAIVDRVATCYAVLGIVHSQWQYVPKEFDDYIANPKPNGYQSLHTVVVDDQGQRIEIQIRTQEMHEFAEHGVAAHWLYKEGGAHDQALAQNIQSLRALLEDKTSDSVFLENFRTEIFSDRVYVLTPAGKLIELVKGATPLDFAYAVHTEIGHRCRGAKVNGRIVPLTYTLHSGETVEILTSKTAKPYRKWLDPNLGYLSTPRALAKVKSWFKQQEQTQNLALGRRILEKEMRRLGVEHIDWDALARRFNCADDERLLIAIGAGDINTRQIAAALELPTTPTSDGAAFKPAPEGRSPAATGIAVAGMNNVLTHFAKCCAPIPGDDIVGFISRTKGITIHRRDCRNLVRLRPYQQTRLLEVSWGKQELKQVVPLIVRAYDRQNLLGDVIQTLNQAKVGILDAQFHTRNDFSAVVELLVQIKDTEQLSQILAKIGELPNVFEARRKT